LEGRLWRWLGAAALVHVAAFAAAGKLDGRHLRAAPPEPEAAAIDIAVERSAAVAKAPEPPPAAPPRLADAPRASLRPVAAPPVPKSPSPRPPAAPPDPRDPLQERFVSALSAVAIEAARILASTQGSGPPIASGNAASASGMVAGDGAGTSPTFDPRAGRRGQPGGSGPPPPPDRSRGASVFMGYSEDCEFPAEADRDRIDHGWAMLLVTVRANGRAAAVQVLDDSGHGFGRMARQCALRARYRPALDASGAPIQADAPSFRYRFTR
jgi:periplasmic protein TonB